MTMLDIVNFYYQGKTKNFSFGGLSKITQALAGNSFNQQLMKDVYAKVEDSGFDGDLSRFGGKHAYADPKSNIGNDVLGMVTSGAMGSEYPDAFMGSYDEAYQVVRVDKKSRSVTVAFAVYNETDTQSLTHGPKILSRAKPNTVNQEYYWTATITP